MASKGTQDKLKVIEPAPIDERSPLLGNSSSADISSPQNGSNDNSKLRAAANNASANDNDNSALEAQAEQERREHDAANVPLADEPSLTRTLLIMCSLWSVSFFAALDMTVVATLTDPISSSFQSGTSFAWIASGYLIANAAFQPLSGRLTDIFGRRAGLIFAVTFFAAGTLICGLAKSDVVMILGRVIAGSGGGCLNTISVFVASDLIPLRKRGVWQGIGNIVYGAGTGLGGVYGGLVNDHLGWRYAFFIQVPLIVLGGIWATFMVKIPVKETDTSKIRRVDFLGALTLVTTLVLLLLGLNSGGNIVPWNHPLVYVSLPLSFVFLCLFIYIEERIATEPIIPVRLLLHQSVAAACLVNWFGTMSVFSILFYAPKFFQIVRAASPTLAGAMFIPHSVGAAFGSLGTGLVMRWTGRYRSLNIFAQLLSLASATLILTTFSADLAPAPPYIYLAMNGTAYGCILTITLIALISAVDHKFQAVITSASYAFRSTGSTIGITAASAVFQNLLQTFLKERFGDSPAVRERIRHIRDAPSEVHLLPDEWRAGVVEAYVAALRGVWVVVLGFAALAAIASLFIRQHTLHSNLERK